MRMFIDAFSVLPCGLAGSAGRGPVDVEQAHKLAVQQSACATSPTYVASVGARTVLDQAKHLDAAALHAPVGVLLWGT